MENFIFSQCNAFSDINNLREREREFEDELVQPHLKANSVRGKLLETFLIAR